LRPGQDEHQDEADDADQLVGHNQRPSVPGDVEPRAQQRPGDGAGQHRRGRGQSGD
jgi:hypothetical protein